MYDWNQQLGEREINPPDNGRPIDVSQERCEHCKGIVYWYERSDCKAEKHYTLPNGYVMKTRIYICRKCQKK